MAPTVLLLGDAGRQPFAGHIAFVRVAREVELRAALRIGGGEGPELAARAARAAAEAIVWAHQEAGSADRHEVLRAIWRALGALDRGSLGASLGQDLSLLLHVADPRGVGVAGVGLAALYELGDSGAEALVGVGHPLLCPPGIPTLVPGVLSPDRPLIRLIGCPTHLGAELPTEDLARRLGVDR